MKWDFLPKYKMKEIVCFPHLASITMLEEKTKGQMLWVRLWARHSFQ
jgi:hypothetical protein